MADGVLAVEARQHDPGDVGVSIVVTVEGHHAEG
jgi:CRISPR/Cas system-associated exonuclease Cas4 (RecB family)